MWTGAQRRSRARAVGGVLLVLAMAACGRSTRDASTGDGAAGDETGGTGGDVGGSSSGGNSGGRAAASGDGGSATGGAGAPGGGGSAGSGGEGARGGSGGEGGVFECVLAMRIGCCPEYVAASRAELAADECLFEYGNGPPVVPPEVAERCAPPDTCTSCAAIEIPSRLVEPDDGDGCRFADECETANDCQVALDCCTCCACARPEPRSFVYVLSCFVPTDDPREQNDVPENMCQVCPTALCAACKARDGVVSCNPTPRGLRRCEWGPPLDARHCNAERPCANLAPGQNMHCSAPGEVACGGPAPPPDECAIDDDCRTESREHYVCEPSGHCGMRRCEPGCLGDMDCSVAEVCGADHRCAPKPCSSAICGGNHTCTDGSCQRRTCTSSDHCGGHCVNGSCYEEPGLCSDRNAP